MANAAKDRKGKSKTAPQAAAQAGPNWPILALAVIGMGLSGYLTYSAWALKATSRLHGGKRVRHRSE